MSRHLPGREYGGVWYFRTRGIYYTKKDAEEAAATFEEMGSDAKIERSVEKFKGKFQYRVYIYTPEPTAPKPSAATAWLASVASSSTSETTREKARKILSGTAETTPPATVPEGLGGGGIPPIPGVGADVAPKPKRRQPAPSPPSEQLLIQQSIEKGTHYGYVKGKTYYPLSGSKIVFGDYIILHSMGTPANMLFPLKLVSARNYYSTVGHNNNVEVVVTDANGVRYTLKDAHHYSPLKGEGQVTTPAVPDSRSCGVTNRKPAAKPPRTPAAASDMATVQTGLGGGIPPIPGAGADVAPPAKPKYKVGDLVYSYQNPTVKRPIRVVRNAHETGGYHHSYIISLKWGGGTKDSNNIDEHSISKTPQKPVYTPPTQAPTPKKTAAKAAKKAAAPKPKSKPKSKAKNGKTATGITLTAAQKKRLAAKGSITIKRDGKFVTITR